MMKSRQSFLLKHESCALLFPTEDDDHLQVRASYRKSKRWRRSSCKNAEIGNQLHEPRKSRQVGVVGRYILQVSTEEFGFID